jgi:hypothetical protein
MPEAVLASHSHQLLRSRPEFHQIIIDTDYSKIGLALEGTTEIAASRHVAIDLNQSQDEP